MSDTQKTPEITSEELTKKHYVMDFSQLARTIVRELDTNPGSNIMFRTFPKERVIDALQQPQRNEKVLRDLSNFLYVLSPHYRRLCTYHAEMPLLNYYIEPHKFIPDKVNIKQFKKAYDESLFELDNMNINHEMGKALQVAFREGIFYGYEHRTDDSYFIQKLNADSCRISTVEDGVYNYEFDFAYFEMDETKLDNYAPEFTTKYNAFKNSKKARKKGEDLQWQEIDSENSICIKTDETILFPFPPFAGVFSEIYEIQDYKSLKKASSEMQNIAILSGTIPMNKNSDTANDFAVDLPTAIQFGNQINTQLPDQMGFILSIFDDMELYKLNDDKVGTDKVEEAVKTFWNSTGVAQNLFTDGGTTNAAIRASLITDEQSVFIMLRQIERWLNRKLKFVGNKKYKFKLTMLDITHQNQDEKISTELKVAQYGIPNKIRLVTTLGLSQSSLEGMQYLEDMLGIPTSWIPLSSSHTSSDANSPTGGDVGKPSESEEDLRTDE